MLARIQSAPRQGVASLSLRHQHIITSAHHQDVASLSLRHHHINTSSHQHIIKT
ncbi:MAG: hypothetical protein R6V49_11530 [Bacteroidales bacterium]